MRGPMRTNQSGQAFRSALIVATLVYGGCGFKPASPTGTGTGTGGDTTVDGGGTGGSGTGGSNMPRPTSLSLDPSNATLTVTNSNATQTQQYTLTGMLNGQMMDLTSQATFSAVPNNIVKIDNTGLATTTGTSGGVVTVTASVGGVST